VVFTPAHHRRNSAREFLPEDATVWHSGWLVAQFFEFFWQ
jgi:hypothetical protein